MRNPKLQRNCIAGQGVFLSDLSSGLIQVTMPAKSGIPVSAYADIPFSAVCVWVYACVCVCKYIHAFD